MADALRLEVQFHRAQHLRATAPRNSTEVVIRILVLSDFLLGLEL